MLESRAESRADHVPGHVRVTQRPTRAVEAARPRPRPCSSSARAGARDAARWLACRCALWARGSRTCSSSRGGSDGGVAAGRAAWPAPRPGTAAAAVLGGAPGTAVPHAPAARRDTPVVLHGAKLGPGSQFANEVGEGDAAALTSEHSALAEPCTPVAAQMDLVFTPVWHVVDARGQPPGRLASQIARILQAGAASAAAAPIGRACSSRSTLGQAQARVAPAAGQRRPRGGGEHGAGRLLGQEVDAEALPPPHDVAGRAAPKSAP